MIIFLIKIIIINHLTIIVQPYINVFVISLEFVVTHSPAIEVDALWWRHLSQ